MHTVNFEDYSNGEFEYMFLSNIIMQPEMIVSYEISDFDFYYDQHKIIFSEMKRQISVNKTFNKPSLLSAFKENKDMYEAIHNLQPMIFCKDSMESYVKTIKDFSRKRGILQAAQQVLNSPELDIEALTEVLTQSIRDDSAEGIKSSHEVAQGILSEMDKPRSCFKIHGLSGLSDCMAGGLYSGYTYGLCGAEKAGKTTLAHSISYGIDCNHLYIAMEMGAAQIEQRNIAREAGKNSLAFLKNPEGMRNNVETLRPNNRFYLDAPGMTLDEILFNITKAIVKHDIKGVIVDYWQLIGGAEKGHSEERHLRNCAQGLANFARKNNIWCVLLAQMNSEGKLFGGNGLRKACDQLYMIEQIENRPLDRWLRMDASRYTLKQDLGSERNPELIMSDKVGPFFYTRETS